MSRHRVMRLSHVRSKLLAFAFLPLMAFVLGGCGGSNSSSQQPPSLDKAVDGVVQNSMQSTGVPGVTVALAQNGAVMYAQGYGFSDLMTHQATQPNVIFEIGSITKQFTAAIIMKLQEMALLHVDDSMATYLPEYGFPSAITIRMLLTHTSGLANYTTFPQFTDWSVTGVSEATVLTTVASSPQIFRRERNTSIPTAITLPWAPSLKRSPVSPTLQTSTNTSFNH